MYLALMKQYSAMTLLSPWLFFLLKIGMSYPEKSGKCLWVQALVKILLLKQPIRIWQYLLNQVRTY